MPAILALAAVNFFWQLGSSSYYVDETLSIEHSLPSLGNILTIVRMTETTPWTFFVLMHEWLYRTGSQAEWVTRLPSAVAGVALVAAVYWMAGAFLDRRPALLAAALCALSPLVLEYAQQVRVYVFVMLAVTIAVGATVRAAAASEHRTRLLLVGALTAILSLWLHYTAALVIVPLCVWLATRRELSWRSRAAFIGACLVAELAVLPLFIDQNRYYPNGGLVEVANLTWTNLVRIAETPFDSRVPGGVDIVRLIGVAIAVGSVIVLLLDRRRSVRSGRLLAALGLFAPLALVIIGIAGKDVVITRYTAVAAPFLLTAVAAAVAMLPRMPAIVLAAAVLVVAGVGLADSHRHAGFYAPAREVTGYIGTYRHLGDIVITTGLPGFDVPLDYYGERLLHPIPEYIAATAAAQLHAAFAQHRRVWIVREIFDPKVPDATLLRSATAILRASDYRAIRVRTFTTTSSLAVFLAVPVPKVP